jgi:hypothetical protein
LIRCEIFNLTDLFKHLPCLIINLDSIVEHAGFPFLSAGGKDLWNRMQISFRGSDILNIILKLGYKIHVGLDSKVRLLRWEMD